MRLGVNYCFKQTSQVFIEQLHLYYNFLKIITTYWKRIQHAVERRQNVSKFKDGNTFTNYCKFTFSL